MKYEINPILTDINFIRFWEERASCDTSYITYSEEGEVEVLSYSIELIEKEDVIGVNFIVKRATSVNAQPTMGITGCFGWNKGPAVSRPINALLIVMKSFYDIETLKQSSLGKEIL